MVLSRRPVGFSAQAGPSSWSFTGDIEEYVVKFFFMSKNIVARGMKKTVKSYKLLDLTNGQAFQFSYDIFVVEGVISEQSSVYNIVKQAFLRKFSLHKFPDEIIASALDAELHWNDLKISMHEKHLGFEKSRINDIARYCLHSQSVNEHPDIAHYGLYIEAFFI